MRWTPVLAIAAILAASALLGVRGSPQPQPSASAGPSRPSVEAQVPEVPSRPVAGPSPVKPMAPEAPAPPEPKDAAREGQRKLAARFAAELSLDASTRTRFIADYMDFAEAAMQIDLKTQTMQTAETVIQSRQTEFEARASVYLTDVQMQRLRELLKGH